MLLRLHNAQGAIPAADGSLASFEVFKQAYEQPLTRIISHTGGKCASSCPPHQVVSPVCWPPASLLRAQGRRRLPVRQSAVHLARTGQPAGVVLQIARG
jgi:hypothetical protein